jgi:hypothetical protein
MRPTKENIIKRAKALDDVIEKRNAEELVSYFADDRVIELLGSKLNGKDGLRRAIKWMFKHLYTITLVPRTIMGEGSFFCVEFTVNPRA